MSRSIALLFLLLLSVPASSQEPQHGMTCQQQLAADEAKIKEWEDWSDRNIPKCKAAMDDADRLEKRNKELEDERPYYLAAVFGAALAVVFAIGKGIKRAWPLGLEKRRLVILLLIAGWISVAYFVAFTQGGRRWDGAGFVMSLPALLFGGIMLWWFGKQSVTSNPSGVEHTGSFSEEIPDPDELEARQTVKSDHAPDWWGKQKK